MIYATKQLWSTMNKLLFLFLFCFMIACSTEKTSDTDKQNASAESKQNVSGTSTTSVASDEPSIKINPQEAMRSSTLDLTVKGSQLEDANIEWLVNGNQVAPQETPGQFKPAGTNKGDTIQARAVIAGKEIFSNTVTIVNAPPELNSVRVMPEVFHIEDRLYIDAEAKDIDGDDVSIAYEWTLNGKPAGSSKEIASEIKRGDNISVKVTPYDGETYGSSMTLNREIRNIPPMLGKEIRSAFDGKIYTYQINAVDPDGDELTYTLKDGPPGMTLDPASGIITWEVPPGDSGSHNITVLISDSQGGELLAPFNLKINPVTPKP
jgi:hypothetical protein